MEPRHVSKFKRPVGVKEPFESANGFSILVISNQLQTTCLKLIYYIQQKQMFSNEAGIVLYWRIFETNEQNILVTESSAAT